MASFPVGCATSINARICQFVAQCTFSLDCCFVALMLMHHLIAGRMRLMTELELRKVLVVIDDTDDQGQLKTLLPPCKLHPESLVVVTSRKSDVLDARCTQVIEVQVLPEGFDVQLFNAWAFAAGRPVWDTSLLVPKVVACCGRLPLTLKVGSAHAPIFLLYPGAIVL